MENPGFDPAVSDPLLPADRIQASQSALTQGCDVIEAKRLPGYATALQRLDAWEANSPAVVSLIRFALTHMTWSVTPFMQKLCHVETLPTGLDPSRLMSAVVYNRDFGARISLPVISELGHVSLAGLLIHESLRHISIAFEDQMTDTALFWVTSRIMLSNPVEGDSLDYHADRFGNNLGSDLGDSSKMRQIANRACTALAENSAEDTELCDKGKARTGKLVWLNLPNTESPGASKPFFNQLLRLDRELVDVIVNRRPEETPPEAMRSLLQAKGDVDMLLDSVVATGLRGAAERLGGLAEGPGVLACVDASVGNVRRALNEGLVLACPN
jgi:hypothetical protein